MISSSRQLAMVKSVAADPGLHALVETFLKDVDVVIAEGYRDFSAHRVEVVRREIGGPLCADQEAIAFVTDMAGRPDVPCFGLEEVVPLADMIEQRFLGKAPWRTAPSTHKETVT